MKDYYEILEISKNASQDEIKSQYRFLIHAWHPDKFPIPDQKTKAEEKLKEINEAYQTLSDPYKRALYDQNYFSSSQPVGETQTASSYGSSSAQYENYGNTVPGSQKQWKYQSSQRCEVCGISAEIKYVEFHQNIGLLIRRIHKSIKGDLCKNCIDFYFWDLTGKTMLFGWWGLISFFSSIFIILNNVFRFIFSRGMKRPETRLLPPPSPFWILTVVGGFALLGYFLFFNEASYYSPSPPNSETVNYSTNSQNTQTIIEPSQSVLSTTIPTKIITPIPTRYRTSTPYNPGCTRWSSVTSSMVGRTICVYGLVQKTRWVGESTFQILFTNDIEPFFLAAGTYYYEVGQGDCVVAEGKVLKNYSEVPYIDIDEALYKCEPWMK